MMHAFMEARRQQKTDLMTTSSHPMPAPCFRNGKSAGKAAERYGGGVTPTGRLPFLRGVSLFLCFHHLGGCGGLFSLSLKAQAAIIAPDDDSSEAKIERENVDLRESLSLRLRNTQGIISDGGADLGGNVGSAGRRRNPRAQQQGKTVPPPISRSLISDAAPSDSTGQGSDVTAGDGNGEKMAKFMLDGKVESFIDGDAMREYLNQLVDITVADTKNQTCNIAFVKTHKTASTTMATILYRYGKRHGLNVANFYGHQSSIRLPEAAKKVQQTGNLVDIMHYHHAWDGFYKGGWSDAKAAYLKIMRDPSDIKLVTVMREPVSHYLSYYYYFLQPETELSITEYFDLSTKPNDPRYERTFLRKRNGNTGWHGFRLLHNPLCAEFGVQNAMQLEFFLQNHLPEFSMIMLTEHFEESLAIFMRMFGWQPIDMTYCRVIETRAGISRYDGKMLANVPRARDLPSEVVNAIHRQTSLDLVLYKASVRIYRQYKMLFEEHLEVDMGRIRTAQSAVHGYLNFNATSPAHKWYEGDVKCFANPSPMQPF